MPSASEFHPGQQRERPAGTHPVLIRPLDRAHEATVRDLFVSCLHEIAPAPAKAEVEACIARALAGDYRDIAAHYRPGRGRGFWMALSRDGGLMGTFALQPSGEEAVELRRIYAAAARRRGVARAMLTRAEALCAGWGFRRLFLTTSTLNRAAIELYRSAGYRQGDYVAGSIQGEAPPPGVRIFKKILGAG